MRVLHVVPSFYPAICHGGPIYSLYSLCNSLAESQVELKVLTTDMSGHGRLHITEFQLRMEVGYIDVIERKGPSQLYGWLGKIPLQYFHDKFKKTIYVVAQKKREVKELDRCPRAYDARGNWEWVKKATE